jgi:hypothetical protein
MRSAHALPMAGCRLIQIFGVLGIGNLLEKDNHSLPEIVTPDTEECLTEAVDVDHVAMRMPEAFRLLIDRLAA